MTGATDTVVAHGNKLFIEQQPVKVLYKSWVNLATAIVTVRCPRDGALQVEVLDAGRLSAGKETDLQEVILSLVFDLSSSASSVQDYSKLNSVFSGITLRLRKSDNLALLKLRANKNSYDSYATPLVKIRCSWCESSDTESPALETVVTDAIRVRSKIKALQNSQNALSRVPAFRQWMEDLEQRFRNGDVLPRLPTTALAVLEASAKGDGPPCLGLNQPPPSNSAHTVTSDALMRNNLNLAGSQGPLANLSPEQQSNVIGLPEVPNHVNLLQILNQQQPVQPQPQLMPPIRSYNASLGSRKRQREPGLGDLPAIGSRFEQPFPGDLPNSALLLQQPIVSSAFANQLQTIPMHSYRDHLAAFSQPQMAAAHAACSATVDQPFNGFAGTFVGHVPGNFQHIGAGPLFYPPGSVQIGPLTDPALMSGVSEGAFNTLSHLSGATFSALHPQQKLEPSRHAFGPAQHKPEFSVDYALPSLSALQALGGSMSVKFPSKGVSLTQPTPGFAFPLSLLPSQLRRCSPPPGAASV